MVNNLKDIFYEDTYIREILLSTSSIAVVGLSDKQNRPSYYAASYLQSRGYKIIPINPSTSNKKILGEKVYKSVFDLNAKPDMIDIFLKQEKISNVTKDAIKIKPNTIWLQLGLIDLKASEEAKKKGINFIMNRCPKIEYARFSGELGWAGVNSQFISNKKIVFKK